MALSVYGNKAVIQFYKSGAYRNFACAVDFSVDYETETVSVKTAGDGYFGTYRGQRIDGTIEFNGLVRVNDGTNPIGFDVLDYQLSFVDIQYRIYFQNSAGDIKVMTGNALPVKSNFSGTAKDFAKASFSLKMSGLPTIADSFSGCSITMIAASVGPNTNEGAPTGSIRIQYTAPAGTLRIEYSIDGGGRIAILSPPVTPSIGVEYNLSNWTGSHTMILYPICTNGEDSINTTTVNFTI